MSTASSTIRLALPWPDVDIYTFGQRSLYGYDSANHCLTVHSLGDVNAGNALGNDRLHLSSLPSWPIRRLVLNEDETILALLAEKIAYLAYLPPANLSTGKSSPSKGSSFCPIIRVPPAGSPSPVPIHCSLIDFVWLTAKHFAIVYSVPSSSECHLYAVRSSKSHGVEHLRSLPVGSSPKNKWSTPNKKISLHQPSEIIKLDRSKRIEGETELVLLFAMKNDGDLFLLEIDQQELLLNNQISEEFRGPICILPSTFDNYGSDHGQSTFICLAESTLPLLVFTRDQTQLHQCLLLSPSASETYFYTVDFLSFSATPTGQTLTTIIPDPFHSNRYFLSDSSANVYLIEIAWLKQIQQGSKEIPSTRIQHLIQGNASNKKSAHRVQQLAVIRTDQTYLAVISKSSTNQQKELILLRLPTTANARQSDFLDQLYSCLSRQQSIPYLTLSSSPSANLSDADVEKHLSTLVPILLKEYIAKQEIVRREIENKQRYLEDFQRTQSNENRQLIERIQQIQQQFQLLFGKYQQECSRQQRLATHLDDLLSIIEQKTPVLSDAEIRMQQQLEVYQTRIDYSKEKVELLRQFLSANPSEGQQARNTALENIHTIVHNQRNQIEQLKKKLETIQNNQ